MTLSILLIIIIIVIIIIIIEEAMCCVCRRNGRFTGFPVMGMRWQRMESHALRSAYGMGKQQKGILVRHIQPTYETAKHLRPDDIIMRFDGRKLPLMAQFLSGGPSCLQSASLLGSSS